MRRINHSTGAYINDQNELKGFLVDLEVQILEKIKTEKLSY